MSLNELQRKHAGETCWIVGKGPSLRHLQADDFGPGPVIALNDAIIAVEKLDIENPIYSLQKDGQAEHMVQVRTDIALILQSTEGFSGEWFPEHPLRYLVDPLADLGFDHVQVLATRMAIEIAKRMGCQTLKLMCCDNLVNGAMETYNPRTDNAEVTGAGYWYQLTRPYILDDLKTIEHDFVLPSETTWKFY